MMEFIDVNAAIVILLIGTGAVLMVLSLLKYRRILTSRDGCSSVASTGLRILHTIHMVLMAFFIFGYLVVLFSLLAGIDLVSELFVSLIFFFGAVFVLFGVIIQEKMLSFLRNTYTNAVRMLVRAVEIRDPYTIGHSEHVANLLVILYDYLPRKEHPEIGRKVLEHAGLLHDIGKIGVPEMVLNKTTPLSEEEWMLIHEHPEVGSELISELEELECISDWVKYHHERVDGSGYYKLPENSIPYVSKMLAVVDTYSALVTDRPYRRGKSHEEAIEILKDCSGGQLDGEIVKAFCTIPVERIETCRPDALVRTFLEEHRLLEGFQGGPRDNRRIDVILSREPGAICLSRLLDYAILKELHLSIAVMELGRVTIIDKEFGYHSADLLLKSFGEALLKNIRETDVIINVNRNTFVLAFADCQSSLAMHLLQRIQSEIQREEFFKPYSKILSIEKRIVYYNPKEKKSLESIKFFIANLHDTSLGML